MARCSVLQASLLVTAGLALVACGAGGGGGTAASALPALGPAPTTTAQAPNTTVTYQVDSASASIFAGSVSSTRLDPTGSGGSVTVTTDGSGAISRVTLNIASAGGSFNQTYTDVGSSSVLSLGQLANLLQLANSTVGANGFYSEGEGLSYSTYGLWASNDSASFGRFGAIATGLTTSTSAMPVTGSGTYRGQTIGAGIDGAGPYALRGNIEVAVSFGTRAATTTISGIQRQNLNTNAVSAGANLTGTGSVTGNRVSTSLAGGGSNGSLVGTFHGPSAEELAGAWRVTGGGNTALGSYGAKR